MKLVLRLCALLLAANAAAAHLRPPDSEFWRAAVSAPRGRVVTKLADLSLDECRAIEAVVGPIAREGERFQTGDVVLDPSLPSRRFLWAEPAGDALLVVALAHGGVAAHDDVLLLERDAKTATLSFAAEASCLLDVKARAAGRGQLGSSSVMWGDGDVVGAAVIVDTPARAGLAPASGCDRFVAPPGAPLARDLAILAHAGRLERDGDNAAAFDDVVAHASARQLRALAADANPAARAFAATAWLARNDVDVDAARALLRDGAPVSDQWFTMSATTVANVAAHALCTATVDPARAAATRELLVASANEAFDGPASPARDDVVDTALACAVDDVRLDRLAVRDLIAVVVAADAAVGRVTPVGPATAARGAPRRIAATRGLNDAVRRAAHATAPDVERAAIAALRQLPKRRIDALLRMRAARELASADAPGAADVIKPMLDDADARVRDVAVRAMAVLSTTTDADVRAYCADRRALASVAVALAEKRDERSVRLLEMLLMPRDVDAADARDALHELEDHRDADVDALVAKLASSSQPEIARWAQEVRAGVTNAWRALP